MHCLPRSRRDWLAPCSGTPRDRLRALFGGELPGVVTFTPRDPAMPGDGGRTDAGEPPRRRCSLRLTRGSMPPREPIRRSQSLAESWLRQGAAGDNSPAQLLIAQAPWTDGDRWIATSFTSGSKRRQQGGCRS